MAGSFRAQQAAHLVFPVPTLYGIQKLVGVVANTVLEDDFDVFDVRNSSRRITFRYDEIRVLPDRD